MSDMYFDTASFDFTSLTDVIGLNDEPAPKVTRDIDNASDLYDLSNIGNDFAEPEQETDFNDDVTDILNGQKPKTNVYSAREFLAAADDDQPIEFIDFVATPKEIKEYLKGKAKLENDASYFAEQAARFDADNKAINARAIMQASVLENNIKILSERLQNPNLPDHEYTATSRQLQQANTAYHQLTQETNAVMQQRAQQEELINGYRIRSADQEMANDFPDWNNIKSSITDYATNVCGIPASTLIKTYDKGLMVALMKAYKFDKNKTEVQERMKNTNTAPGTVKSTKGAVTSQRNAKLSDVDQAKAKAAISKMGGTRQSNIDAFNYLKD